MEKHLRSSAKPIMPANDDPYSIRSFIVSKRARTPDARTPTKPSREEVSKCISIWATMYHLRDTDDTDNNELCIPSRPWIGRSSNSLKRFE